jgi:segregation and condensation protein B
MFGRKGVKRVEAIESEETDAVETEGFSLEELGTAYAVAIGQASGETNTPKATEQEKDKSDAPASATVIDSSYEKLLDAPKVAETDGVPVTAESILEAMLFLGSSNNQPLAVDKLVELFRGVTAEEIDRSVDKLNALYRQGNRAMVIVRAAGGYLMQLAPELHLIRDRFYGKVKETQLTQAAIDCLSLVAYQPGVTRESIEKQWNQPAAGMLSTLVRKGLLRIEKRPSENRSGEETQYFTTDRFLEVIGLGSLEDLPLSEDI